MDEQELRDSLSWFDPYELPRRLDKWRERRSHLLERAEASEMDSKLKNTIWNAIEDAESLASELQALSDLLDLEIAPLQKLVDDYRKAHPDEDDWDDDDLDEDDWDEDDDDGY